MRLLTRLDQPELLEPVPDGIIGAERTRPRLELSQGIQLGTTEVEWIRHLVSDLPRAPVGGPIARRRLAHPPVASAEPSGKRACALTTAWATSMSFRLCLRD